MSNASVYSSIKNISEAYQAKINSIPAADFQKMPSIGGWSYSEVYFHIFDASMLSLQQLEKSMEGKGKRKKTPLIAKLILFFGSFPPMKFKAPAELSSRLKKVTQDEAHILISSFLIQLEADYPKMQQADKNVKTRHPRLGHFNATQWLRFIEIHLKHHFKQLKRIEKSF